MRPPGTSNWIENLYPKVPGLFTRACITLVFTEAQSNSCGVEAHVWRDIALTAMGLILAICTGNPKAKAAHRQRPLRHINLTDKGEVFREARGIADNSGSKPPAPALTYSSRFDSVFCSAPNTFDGSRPSYIRLGMQGNPHQGRVPPQMYTQFL